MGGNWLFSGSYGADAKAKNAETDSKHEDWKNGAWAAYGDTAESDAFKGDLDERMKAIAARTPPKVSGPTFDGSAYTTAAKVGPVAKATGATIDRSGDLAMRARQQEALSMFAAAAAGKGPSVAGAQMNAGVDQSLAARAAAAGSAPRGGGGLAALLGARGQSQVLGAASATSAATKSQEAMQGAQQFGSLSAGMRTADIGAALAQGNFDQQAGLTNAQASNAAILANAGFAQQAGMFNATAAQTEAEMRQKAELANVEAALRSRGMNDAAIASYLAAYQKQFQADKQAKMAFWGTAQDKSQFDQKMAAQKNAQDQSADYAKAGAIAKLLTLGAA